MAKITNETLSVLNTGFSKVYQNAIKDLETTYTQVATVVKSSTASNTYGWLGEMPELREWIGERAVKDFKTHGYTITNKLFESTIGVQRTDIEDDNIGIYSPLFASLARRAKQQPDEMVYSLLPKGTETNCYDGQPFFSASHPLFEKHDGTGDETTQSNFTDGEGEAWYLLDTKQALKPLIFQVREEPELTALTKVDSPDVFMKDRYLYGVRARHNAGYGFWQMAHMSKKPLTAANFNKALEAMMSLQTDGGKFLNIRPTLLVVPPTLRSAALEIVKAERLSNGKTNVNQNVVELLVTPLVLEAK